MTLPLQTYPANIRIQKPPPNAIFADFFHSPTPVQEDRQHSFPEINNRSIFLGFGWFRSVVGYSMFVRDWRNDQSWVEAYERSPQRREFRVPSPNFQILIHHLAKWNAIASGAGITYSSPYCVHNEASPALMVLPGVGDKNRHFRILVE